MGNCLICGERDGLKVVWTLGRFDEVFNRTFFDWTYGYTENSWLTEKEAVYKTEALICDERLVKNIHIKQQQGDGSWIIIDLKTSPYAHHNKIAPTIE